MIISDTIIDLLVLSVIPVSLLFLAERFLLFYLARSPIRVAWVRSKKWLHPNFISRCRYPSGVIAILFYHMGYVYDPGNPVSPWHYLAIFWFAFWTITDITDGTIAREFDLHSEEGESIDPLSDKLLILPTLLYFAYLGVIPLVPVILFIIIDFFGQFSRYFIVNKAANLFGKAKTFLAVLTLILISMQRMYFPDASWEIYQVTLITAVFLAFFSMFFKVVPNYWYANILSIMNFICGLSGIILVLFYNRPGIAFSLVFLGQFLDMFDGRAAERWGSTPKGELLDDLADGTNFGGSIATIIYFAFNRSTLGIILAIVHMTTTAYRLYRFIKNKKEAGVEGGVSVFSGLPSPAGALLAGSIALIDINEYFKIACLIFTSLLMISKLPYIHFARVILPNIPKMVKVFLLVMIIFAVWFGFRPGNIQFLYWMFFVSAILYVIFGYQRKKNGTNE
jgi:CDP-diacylglycerol---serine O-phosphatidyltransferase